VIRRRLGGARAWFTDRTGGASVPPYASLNLADHVGDDPDAVAANRRAAAVAAGCAELVWVQPHHVHGTTVLAVTAPPGADGAAGAEATGREADGAATARTDRVLVAIGADCAPVAIANDTACAAVHAGWRGATGGVLEAGVAAVRALGSGPVHVVVGPCICVEHYEFGARDLEALVDRLGPTVAGRTVTGAPAFDLRGALAEAARRASVDHVEILDVCTYESADHYSYRRDRVTGRHGVMVARA